VHSSKHLELAPKARVTGNVYYTLVEMAVGSEVNGSLQHVVEQEGTDVGKNPDPTVAVTEVGAQRKEADSA
jgi:cytoskeletal protein CcmA (bactofilin family)